MAIVKKYEYPGGTVLIDDDHFRGVSPQEMKKKIERAQRVARELMNYDKEGFDGRSG